VEDDSLNDSSMGDLTVKALKCEKRRLYYSYKQLCSFINKGTCVCYIIYNISFTIPKLFACDSMKNLRFLSIVIYFLINNYFQDNFYINETIT